jgi:predicted alpha/beta hydrolase family esterase
VHYVIIPGIDGSGREHWQTLWEEAWGSSATRIRPSSWDNPDLDDWCLALDNAMQRHRSSEVVLVAHSLGCLAAASWLRRHQPGVRGAFLVAAPDPAGPGFPAAASTFATPDPMPLPVPGLLISSDDDPYCTPQAALTMADIWGIGHVSIGRAGHVNTASGHGAWDSGQALLSAFTAGWSGMSAPPDGLPAYRVLTGPDDAAFCHRVSEAITLGYRLHDGPALTYNGKEVIVAQALVWQGT